MSIRSRFLVVVVFLILLPLCVLAFFIHRETTKRLSDQYAERIAGLAEVLREDLARHNADIHARLAALKVEIAGDDQFHLAPSEGREDPHPYQLDYAGRVMKLLGLSMLRIQDSEGLILSSGHFRSEYDHAEPNLPALVAASPDGMVLASIWQPEGSFLVLACVDSMYLGQTRLTLTGGVTIDESILRPLSPSSDLTVSLICPDGVRSSDAAFKDVLSAHTRSGSAGLEVTLPDADYLVQTIQIPYALLDGSGNSRTTPSYVLVTYPKAPLRKLLKELDLWLLLALAASAVGSLLLAIWLSARISRPITELAQQTAKIDLDHLYLGFEKRRRDEVGTLARFLDHMTRRLRAGAEKLREAERRATLGEISRQVNHDIKNGLAPLRNIMRHFSEVASSDSTRLGSVFKERRGVVESSIAYLDGLAANYARISTQPQRTLCDMNAVVRHVAASTVGGQEIQIELDLASDLSRVMADPIALRRIVENLVRNARDSLGESGGKVTLSTEDVFEEDGTSGICLTVTDDGPGIPEEDLARIFEDFYTTKPKGAGLGLSIVRRLVADFDGHVRAESEPGMGARFIVWLPALGNEKEDSTS